MLCVFWVALTGCDGNPPSLASNPTATNIAIIASPPPPVCGTIKQEINEDWAVLLHQGKYRVINNVWNKGIASGGLPAKGFFGDAGRKRGVWLAMVLATGTGRDSLSRIGLWRQADGIRPQGFRANSRSKWVPGRWQCVMISGSPLREPVA